jgi:hypothetical protein
MRKILLVHNESYLDRALEDALYLIGYERQRTSKNEVLDLLAVILTPLSGDGSFTSEDQTVELSCLTDDTRFFNPDSVSVSGIWLLLTINQSDLADSTERQEALTRILNVLRVKEGVRRISAVMPIFSAEESERSVAEQMAYLESERHSIPISTPFVVDFQEHPPTLTRFGLRTQY